MGSGGAVLLVDSVPSFKATTNELTRPVLLLDDLASPTKCQVKS